MVCRKNDRIPVQVLVAVQCTRQPRQWRCKAVTMRCPETTSEGTPSYAKWDCRAGKGGLVCRRHSTAWVRNEGLFLRFD